MNNIVLLRPNLEQVFGLSAPTSLGYLASSVRQSNFSVDIVDATLHNYSIKETVNLIISKKVNVVGIQVYSGTQWWVKEFICELKKFIPECITIVGGPHITALEEFSMQHIQPDFGILGEGEDPLRILLTVLREKINDFDSVPGLIYKKDSTYIKNKKKVFIKDLDSLPLPAWDLINPKKYAKFTRLGATMASRGKTPVSILTSRGCPYACTFCSTNVTWNGKMRYRSPAGVIHELELLKNTYGVDEFYFGDDNLTMDKKRAEKIFDLLIEKNINIPWRAPNGLRIDTLDENLIRKMKKSGCYYVGLAVETGNEEIMRKIKKKLSLEIVGNVVKLFKKYGIFTCGFFMVGLIDDTKHTIMETIDFAKRVGFDRLQVSVFTPYPGSEDFIKIFSNGNYKESVYNYLHYKKMPKINKNLSNEEIHYYQKLFIKKFYFRLPIILSLIKNLKYDQILGIINHPFIKRWFWSGDNTYTKDSTN